MFIISSFETSASGADIILFILFDVIRCYGSPVYDILSLALPSTEQALGTLEIDFRSGWSLLSNNFLLWPLMMVFKFGPQQ